MIKKNKYSGFSLHRSLLMLSGLFLVACTGAIFNTSTHIYGPFNLNEVIAVVPFANNTETPLVGERAMSITAAILESKGFCHLRVYSPSSSTKQGSFPGIDQSTSQKASLNWARHIHARYVMTGSVNEWGYKVGLDGEPVVGLTMQLMDLKDEKILWAGVGSESGGSRIAVSTVAQRLLNRLLQPLS